MEGGGEGRRRNRKRRPPPLLYLLQWLSGVRTSENQITPGAQLYTPVPHELNSVTVLCAPTSLYDKDATTEA